MEKKLFDIHKNMIYLGEQSLKHANYLANYVNIGFSEHWDVLSVLQAAHAMEMFVKARIAQEHPLLIIDKYPKETPGESLLGFSDLMDNATTIQYKDLPSRLWASTGIRIENIDLFKSFGFLRNKVQHMAIPEETDFVKQSNDYIYTVIHPFIFKCWGIYAIDYIEDEHYYEGMVSILIKRKTKLVISPGSVDRITLEEEAIEIIKSGDDYSSWFQEMMSRNNLDINKLIK